MINKEYSALATVYEKLIDKDDYKKWSSFICNSVVKNSSGKIGIDMACGSGYFTRELKKVGYSVVGVDSSQEMLKKAQELAIDENLQINYFLSKMQNFKYPQKVDFLTIVNDGVNYINSNDLIKTFKNLSKLLKPKGLFLFDISSSYKLKNILGNNLFCEDLTNVSYMWFNKLLTDRVQMDLSVFTKNKNGFYSKNEEFHEQFIHELNDVKLALNQSGFEIIEITAHLGEELQESSERINFIARKV